MSRFPTAMMDLHYPSFFVFVKCVCGGGEGGGLRYYVQLQMFISVFIHHLRYINDYGTWLCVHTHVYVCVCFVVDCFLYYICLYYSIFPLWRFVCVCAFLDSVAYFIMGCFSFSCVLIELLPREHPHGNNKVVLCIALSVH